MQKKLIALAIAGLSGAAFAQSNVTIYGVADATYDYVSATGATAASTAAVGQNYQSRGRTTMNSSYVGFKGVESLGNGLAVAFQVETAFNENNGAGGVGASTAQNALGGTWGNRDTYVGLAGSFGTIAAGVLTGPTRALGAAMDVNSGATGIGANTALLGKYGGGGGAGVYDQRINNAIAYISPNWSGFSFVVGYLPNENRGTDPTTSANAANTSAWDIGGTYAAGPVYVSLAWEQIKDTNATSTASQFTVPGGPLTGTAISKVADTRLGAKYDFGMGTIGVLWDHATADVSAGGGVNLTQNAWYIPVTFKVGEGKIIAQYGQAKNISGSVTNAVLVNKDYGAKHFELGYEYSLSKRTTLKAIYSKITNNADATYDYLYGVSNPNSTTQGAGVKAGSDPSGVSFGLRHSF